MATDSNDTRYLSSTAADIDKAVTYYKANPIRAYKVVDTGSGWEAHTPTTAHPERYVLKLNYSGTENLGDYPDAMFYAQDGENADRWVRVYVDYSIKSINGRSGSVWVYSNYNFTGKMVLTATINAEPSTTQASPLMARAR